MIQLTETAVIDALRNVQEPELGRDIVTLNMVKDIVIDGQHVAFTIELTTPACPLKDEIEMNAQAAVKGIGADAVDITWAAMVRRASPARPQRSSRASRTSSRSPRARAGSARAPSRSTSPWPSPRPARRSASSTPTSRVRTSR